MFSVLGCRLCDHRAAGGVHVAPVQLLAAGLGLGEDESLQAARRRSRWLPTGRVRSGDGEMKEGMGSVSSREDEGRNRQRRNRLDFFWKEKAAATVLEK